MTWFRFRLLPAALLWLCGLALSLPARAEPVTVFAAASLKTALDAVAKGYAAQTGTQVTLSYAGSSALARQIQYGAPADLYISANTLWMDVLDRDGLLVPGTRVDLLSNRLVLIGPAGAGPLPPDEIATSLGQRRLAMALVDAVPAGIYGRAALESLGLWGELSDRVAQADNVRAALALVALGEAPLGITYATDAQAEPRVAVRHVFAADTHPPIRYPVAALREGADVDAFLAYLQGESAAAIFAAQGFAVLERP
ncbi:molybdate ABC transporter substrate-binding protein [Pseudoponticoccus marisrubri]|uniref:Molybdate-binding protein ModA n=1 Tax=Pseudoponticoccus marisrubri TaxID=1685382 RepID=A0A0W7WIX4_9RHOB|nr:molybdate ABC transporter substrate-binding protein [Pseudoponticoccus marisrubri]KUF10579.1 molybdenum ABC transporter substrate-binding protein [Pseudoponticoccus marisrubri]